MDERSPSPDLVCHCPNCPICGKAGEMMVDTNRHLTAWCVDDDCPGGTWDPTLTAAELTEDG